MKLSGFAAVTAAAVLLAACGGDESAEQQTAAERQEPAEAAAEAVAAAAVIDTYVEIARAAYEDSVQAARELQDAVNALIEAPGEDSLAAARDAWRASRVPYMQTEVYRFGNPVVDELEAKVNSWPLDEGLIDYTAASYGEGSDFNFFYTANVIANESFEIGGISVDAAEITPALLADTLHMLDGVETNVATGYHAVEFLLWGQDLHGTEPGAGERPWTDYSLDDCSNGNCERRRQFLQAAAALLVSDLEAMAQAWQEGGAAYEDLLAKGPEGGLATMLTGMGSLAYGELAGERTRLALLLNDPEEEHDCFSDNTHWSHYYDAQGIANVWYGEYTGPDGDTVSGPSLEDMVRGRDPGLAERMASRLAETEAAMQAMVDQAMAGNTFDVLIAPANTEGEAVVTRAVDALVAETRAIEDVIAALGLQNISIEGSDSLDNPALVL